MKKLVLLFVLFFCSSVFSSISGIAWTTIDTDKIDFEINSIDNSFTLTILSGQEVTASANEIKGTGIYDKYYLKLMDGARLLNKENEILKIASNITVLMQGSDLSPSVIHSRNKNLTIDGNLEITGYSIISTSGENGADGTWHGPKDEENRCRHSDDDGCGAQRPCSQDVYNESARAKEGGNAGLLLIKNVEIKADVNFSANGGNGGNGAYGWGEDEGPADGQEAIGGGDGKKGGNAEKIIIENLIAENGTINFNSFGGDGGNGGNGGNDIGDDDHLGGRGGKGGNSGSVEIQNLDNSSAQINVFSLAGKGGKAGHTPGASNNYCNPIWVENGTSDNTKFVLANSSGFVPLKIFGAENISIKSKPFEYLYFFPETKYTALGDVQITGCRLKGDAMLGFGSGNLPLVSIDANSIDFNVFNPLKFYDRVELNANNSVTHHKNEVCNLTASEKKDMVLPFNGKINGVNSGFVKNIKITNIANGLIDFELDSTQRDFSNEMFSTEINASLYPNTFYTINFTVCRSSANCKDFSFNFFTWKRSWQ